MDTTTETEEQKLAREQQEQEQQDNKVEEVLPPNALVAALFGDVEREIIPALEEENEADAAKKAAEEAEAKAAADKAAADAAAAAEAEKKPKPAKPAPVVGVVSPEDEHFIEHQEEPAKPAPRKPAPTLAPAGTSAEDEAYVAGLTAEQHEELREAEVAERLFPDKHKGRRANLIAFYRKFDDGVKALLAEDSERKLDDSDEGFQKLFKGKPALQPAEYKKVVRDIATEEASTKAKADLAPQLGDLELKTRRLEVQPKVDKFVNETFGEGVKTLFETDEKSPLAVVTKFSKEKGMEAAAKEYPLEFTVAAEEVSRSQRQVHKFLMLSKGAENYSDKNPLDRSVLTFINEQGEAMKRTGGKLLTNKGRKFLTRVEFNQMLDREPAEASTLDPRKWTTKSYWSFTDSNVVDMFAIKTKSDIESRVDFEQKRAEALGFSRTAKKTVAESAKPKKEVKDIEPPKARQSAAAPAADPNANPDQSIDPTALFPKKR